MVTAGAVAIVAAGAVVVGSIKKFCATGGSCNGGRLFVSALTMADADARWSARRLCDVFIRQVMRNGYRA